MNILLQPSHQNGDIQKQLNQTNQKLISVDTFNGVSKIEWDPDAEVTPNGQMVFFIEFLKISGIYEEWLSSCPLEYKSNNASSIKDILGTTMISVLSGHKRYSHISTIRNDGVNPQKLGMSKVVSEDAVRRAMSHIDQQLGSTWLFQNLFHSYKNLLKIGWILDIDSTVKTLYGHQEGAEVGYNPRKPGKASHSYHAYYIGTIRIILDVDVASGTSSSGCHSAPNLWKILDHIPQDNIPSLIRGDCSYSSESIISELESRGLKYLFKLKQTSNVKKKIVSLSKTKNWQNAGYEFEAIDTQIKLSGWSKSRKIIILRKKISKQKSAKKSKSKKNSQLEFKSEELLATMIEYDYQVLVTNTEHEFRSIVRFYRDRGDSENNFDELKNQWGWCGYTTKDMKRNSFMARIIALIYNWWTIFTRLANPDYHYEAITSRPLLLSAIAKQTTHAGQSKITVTSTHSKSSMIIATLSNVSVCLQSLISNAEPLNTEQIFNKILMIAFRKFTPQNFLKHVLTPLAP